MNKIVSASPTRFKFIQLFFLCFASVIFFSIPFNVNAKTFPSGFSQLKVGNIYYPTSMAFTPDSRNYKGKVLRINKDGSIPTGNPFIGSETQNKFGRKDSET